MSARRRIITLPTEHIPVPVSGAPCGAWSHHAAELAESRAAHLQRWPESPTTQRLVEEGFLERLLPGIFCPPDLLATAVDRALCLGAAIGDRLQPAHVLAGPSAAWVLLGGRAPEPAELLSSSHRGPVAGALIRHGRLDPSEVEIIGGAPLTSPSRTAVDLLRFTPEPAAVRFVARLLASGHLRPAEVHEQLQSRDGYSGVRRAEELLELAAASVSRFAQPAARGEPDPIGLPSAVTRYAS